MARFAPSPPTQCITPSVQICKTNLASNHSDSNPKHKCLPNKWGQMISDGHIPTNSRESTTSLCLSTGTQECLCGKWFYSITSSTSEPDAIKIPWKLFLRKVSIWHWDFPRRWHFDEKCWDRVEGTIDQRLAEFLRIDRGNGFLL